MKELIIKKGDKQITVADKEDVTNALNSKVSTDDPRLSNARTPLSHTHKDGDISYESSMNSVLSPIDMAVVDMAHANRLAFIPPANITVEVSTNGGSSWSTYPSITDAMKTRLVSLPIDETNNLYSGGTSSASANNKIRITLDAGEVTSSQGSKVYCSHSKKIIIGYTTNGATGNSVKIEVANYPNQTTWEDCGTYYLGGWWGWNSIPFFKTFGAYQNQQNDSTRYRYIRLTFSNTGGTGSPVIKGIRLYSTVLYVGQSTMAKTGNIYSYNENQDVIFPAKIIKSGGTSSQFLKADGSVDNNSYSVTGHTHTKLSSNGSIPSTATSLEDYTEEGYYLGGSTVAGKITDMPYTGNYSFLIENKHYADSFIQFCYKMPGTNLTEIYYRKKVTGNDITDWRRIANKENEPEYITSTHASGTNAWTGTCTNIAKVEKGTHIFYRLNQNPTTDNVTLNLTLRDGTTTGAKSVYIGGSRLTNQFGRYNVIHMVLDQNGNWLVLNGEPKTTTATVTYVDGSTGTINFVTR